MKHEKTKNNTIRTLSFFFVLSMVLGMFLLSSCVVEQGTGNNGSNGTTAPDTTQETTPETNPGTAPSIASKGPIVLEIYDDGVELSTLGEHIYFVDETALNNGWVLVFKTNVTIRDLKFLSIDESNDLEIESVLYTVSELTPDKPFVASTYINDATVNRGISFVDADGNTKYYAIEWSGRGGLLSLSEITFTSDIK